MPPKNKNQTQTLPTGTPETALRVFHRIAHAWGLDDSEVSELLGTPGSTDETISEAAMERISYVFGRLLPRKNALSEQWSLPRALQGTTGMTTFDQRKKLVN